MEYIVYREGDELYHHGIRGQRWGIRRFQNEDGSLTSAGDKRYNATDQPFEKEANANADTKKPMTTKEKLSKIGEKYATMLIKEIGKNTGIAIGKTIGSIVASKYRNNNESSNKKKKEQEDSPYEKWAKEIENKYAIRVW